MAHDHDAVFMQAAIDQPDDLRARGRRQVDQQVAAEDHVEPRFVRGEITIEDILAHESHGVPERRDHGLLGAIELEIFRECERRRSAK
jgi:hypothetical protein